MNAPRHKISDHDRDMIDQFLATRGATICPPCTFTPNEDFTPKTRQKNAFRNKRLGAKMKAAQAQVTAKQISPPCNKTIARMRQSGLTFADIAASMGLTKTSVAKRYARMKAREMKNAGP